MDKNNDSVVPLIIDGRTLVPVRFISESFGANVDWNDETSEITVTLRSSQIDFDSIEYFYVWIVIFTSTYS